MESLATPDADAIDVCLNLAAEMVEEGRVLEALAFAEAVEESLDEKGVAAVQVYVAVGALKSLCGDMEGALAYLASAVDLDPANPLIRAGYERVVAQTNAVLIKAMPLNERGLRLARMLVGSGLASDRLRSLVAVPTAANEPIPHTAVKA